MHKAVSLAKRLPLKYLFLAALADAAFAWTTTQFVGSRSTPALHGLTFRQNAFVSAASARRSGGPVTSMLECRAGKPASSQNSVVERKSTSGSMSFIGSCASTLVALFLASGIPIIADAQAPVAAPGAEQRVQTVNTPKTSQAAPAESKLAFPNLPNFAPSAIPNLTPPPIPDIQKLGDDLTKQLNNIKLPEKPEDVVDALKNVHIPQPGEEVVLPTGGRFRIPEKLEAKEGIVVAPTSDKKYNFQNVQPEKSQKEIMEEMEAKERARKAAEEAARKAAAEAAARKAAEEVAARKAAEEAAARKAAEEVAARKAAQDAAAAAARKAAADKAAAAAAAAKKAAEPAATPASAPAAKAARKAPAAAPPAAEEGSRAAAPAGGDADKDADATSAPPPLRRRPAAAPPASPAAVAEKETGKEEAAAAPAAAPAASKAAGQAVAKKEPAPVSAPPAAAPVPVPTAAPAPAGGKASKGETGKSEALDVSKLSDAEKKILTDKRDKAAVAARKKVIALQAEAAKAEQRLTDLTAAEKAAEIAAEAAKKAACEGQFICIKGIFGF